MGLVELVKAQRVTTLVWVVLEGSLAECTTNRGVWIARTNAQQGEWVNCRRAASTAALLAWLMWAAPKEGWIDLGVTGWNATRLAC